MARELPDLAELIDLLRISVDRDMGLFDTAETYGPWTNEEMVGEALQPARHKVKIATKLGRDVAQVRVRRRRSATRSSSG